MTLRSEIPHDPASGAAAASPCTAAQGDPAIVAFSAGAPDASPGLAPLVDALLASYRSDARAHHINKRFLPSRDEAIEIIHLLLQLFYPGYFGRQDLTDENVGYHVGMVLSNLREKLERQVELCLCYRGEAGEDGRADVPRCRYAGRITARRFLERLPAIRSMLIEDVQAAYDGDPAALNYDEVILAYPGLLAITVYRIAHELHELGVPMMPRIMTEWAHAQTGADLHPGAKIGRAFFLDHATGAVVGETTVIGDHVKLYQGVTLGALSIHRDARGRVIRGTKRHPTVEDRVTIYANATVLGGSTVLGEGSLVGGSVFVTKSVPPGAKVALKPPELEVNTGSRRGANGATNGAAGHGAPLNGVVAIDAPANDGAETHGAAGHGVTLEVSVDFDI